MEQRKAVSTGLRAGALAGTVMGAIYILLDYIFNVLYFEISGGVPGTYSIFISIISGVVAGCVFTFFFIWVFYNLPRSANILKVLVVMTVIIALRMATLFTQPLPQGSASHVTISALKVVEALTGTMIFLMVYMLCLGYFWGRINAGKEPRPILNTRAMKIVRVSRRKKAAKAGKK